MAERVDSGLQNQWQAGPDEEIKIPEAYVRQLKFEIVVFSPKRHFTFRCRDFKANEDKTWTFDGVIIDTSKRNSLGKPVLKRLTYHPVVSLCNVGFMVIPASESE